MRELVDDKEVITVEFPGEPPRYELAGKEHHHHFRCMRCRKVYELDGSCLGDIKTLVPRGFRLVSHELLAHGECASCIRR
jgi:Fur family ferric uptake transcriptional regulator